MNIKPLLLLSFTAAATVSAPASAQEPVAPPQIEAEATPRANDLSITVSPIHLLMPVVEVTAEKSLGSKVGAAIIGGAGSFDDFLVLEVGTQFRFYALGNFDHGLQLGAELLYVHVSSDDVLDSGVGGAGEGLAVGPFVGYKYTAEAGFTVDLQAGAQYMALTASADDDSEASDESVIPLVNVNLGWSF